MRGSDNGIHVVVKERTTATGENCGDEKAPPPGLRIFSAGYRWDARRERFVTQSTLLEKLVKENAKRF